MKDWHARTWRGGHVPIQELSLELGSEIDRKVAAHERGPVGLVATHAERLAVCVVNRRVERAGDDECAELGDWCGQRAGAGERGGCAEVRWFEHAKEIDRMTCVVAFAGQRDELSCERHHRPEPRVLGGG